MAAYGRPFPTSNFFGGSTCQEEFVQHLVTAFAASNIPFEKLKKAEAGESTLLRQFLDKHFPIDGQPPSIPDPINLRANHLPKAMRAGVHIFR